MSKFRLRVGVTSEIETKKAELDALDLQVAVQRLQNELAAARASIRR